MLYLIGLVVAFSSALPAYVNSNFISQFTDISFVSLFFVLANLATLIFILGFPKTIKRFGKHNTFKLLLFLYSASLFFFAVANSAITALIGIAFFTIFLNLLWIKLDLFIEVFTKNIDTGKVRALYLTICNLGWVLAPTFSGYLIDSFGYSFVYWLSGSIIIPTLIFFLIINSRLKAKIKYAEDGMKKVIKKVWRNKNLRGIFFVALILQLFYTTAVVYIPLYLHQTLGMSWEILGPIFSFMLIPFIIFQIPAGFIADKYFGEKEMLYLGLTILSFSLIAAFYLNQPIAWLWAGLLFFSRIGAALVEAMRESYFFKLVSAKDLSMIHLFRLTGPIAYIIGPALAILITTFLPIHFIFLFSALLTASGIILIWPMKDSL
ncbi:MFS transporter [Patescibacteria group bacterium]|nr:MFS transporter [Patescibacteria group bacterium]